MYVSVALMIAQDMLNSSLCEPWCSPHKALPDKHLPVSLEAKSSSPLPRGLDRQVRKKLACSLQRPQEGRSDRILDHRSESTNISTRREVSTRK